MKIEGALIDLSGTLIIDDAVIPGAVEALQRLYDHHIKVKFITNTTKESIRELHNRLVSLSLPIEKEDVFSSLTAARALVEKRGLRPLLFLDDRAKEDFEGISTENPDSVLIGLAPSCFTYELMNKAFCMVIDGAPLIAIHKARYYAGKESLFIGPGAFVAALEYATEEEAEVVGKPSKQFFMQVLESMGIKAGNTIMIGDDVRDDVEGAMKAGMKGLLVKTGKYMDGDEGKIQPKPTHVSPSIVEAVDYILENRRLFSAV